MYKWGYALEKLQFTNFDLQIYNCKVARLACSGYKVPTLHLQNTKLHSSNFCLQVWNDITHMYIYGTTNNKYWFTNLQLHGCSVRILTPLAFHSMRPYIDLIAEAVRARQTIIWNLDFVFDNRHYGGLSRHKNWQTTVRFTYVMMLDINRFRSGT